MKRKRKTQIIISVIALLSVLIIASATIIFIGRRQIQEYKQTISDLQTEMEANHRVVYVPTVDIKAGERIEDNVNVVSQKVYSGMEANNYITAEELGSKAVVDIPLGTAIQKNMVTDVEITKDSRDYEVSVASLMTNQENHDVVDVRIWFPDGSDYIILSKKEIYNLDMGASVFDMLLNEEEILRLKSATVDGMLNAGKIYTTRYVSTTLQEAATEFYPVNETVLNLIQSGDPNILTRATETLNAAARMDLEARLGRLSPDAISAVAGQTGAGEILTGDNAGSTSSFSSTGYTNYSEDLDDSTSDSTSDAQTESQDSDVSGDSESNDTSDSITDNRLTNSADEANETITETVGN